MALDLAYESWAVNSWYELGNFGSQVVQISVLTRSTSSFPLSPDLGQSCDMAGGFRRWNVHDLIVDGIPEELKSAIRLISSSRGLVIVQ